jgi:HAMP domain-containing protein
VIQYLQTFLSALGVNENRKARNILIRPGFQLRLPFYILLLTFSFVFLTLLLGNLYLEQAYVSMIENTTQSEYLQQVITEQISSFKVITLLILFVYAVLVVVITSVYTHRLLGPMIPIARHLKALKEGFYTHRVHLRKKDALHGLAGQLNELAEVLEERK